MKKTISNTSIFGEYKKPEDRVTVALLHVLQQGGQSVIRELFGDKFDIPSNEINVIPQSYNKSSIPDGELSCVCNYHIYIESKIATNAINVTQLKKHKQLTNTAASQYLIYITPDKSKPKELIAEDVEWISWDDVIEILSDIKAEGILAFLIEHFILLVEHIVGKSNLIPEHESVIIVGGRWGERIACEYNFYACQPNRKFRPSKYLAFYYQHRIKYLFEIVNKIDSVDIKTLKEVNTTKYFNKEEKNYKPEQRLYMQLKLHKKFDPEIINDKKDKKGENTAFVQSQTYTSYNKIIKAKKTSDLY